jgi:hypothetical protein
VKSLDRRLVFLMAGIIGRFFDVQHNAQSLGSAPKSRVEFAIDLFRCRTTLSSSRILLEHRLDYLQHVTNEKIVVRCLTKLFEPIADLRLQLHGFLSIRKCQFLKKPILGIFPVITHVEYR